MPFPEVVVNDPNIKRVLKPGVVVPGNVQDDAEVLPQPIATSNYNLSED